MTTKITPAQSRSLILRDVASHYWAMCYGLYLLTEAVRQTHSDERLIRLGQQHANLQQLTLKLLSLFQQHSAQMGNETLAHLKRELDCLLANKNQTDALLAEAIAQHKDKSITDRIKHYRCQVAVAASMYRAYIALHNESPAAVSLPAEADIAKHPATSVAVSGVDPCSTVPTQPVATTYENTGEVASIIRKTPSDIPAATGTSVGDLQNLTSDNATNSKKTIAQKAGNKTGQKRKASRVKEKMNLFELFKLFDHPTSPSRETHYYKNDKECTKEQFEEYLRQPKAEYVLLSTSYKSKHYNTLITSQEQEE